MSRARRVVLGLGGLAVAAVVAERVAARRMRGRRDAARDALLVPPPDVHHRTVPTHDGGELHLIERGAGRPVVLLHGITLHAELWSPQLHGLAADHRVIAVDLRGHGRSRAGSDGFGMRQLAADVASVLTGLDLRDALVVGHSMGGMATLNFAVEHPDLLRERVSGLGLVATAASRPVFPLLVPWATALGARVIERLDDGKPVPGYRFTGNDLSLFLIRSVFGKDPSAAAIEQVRASIEATDQDAVARSLVGIIDEHDTTDHLGEIDVPAFVVVGSRDVLTPPAFARAMAERLPDAELTVLPGAGHQLMQERPEEVDRLVRALSLRTPVGGSRPAVAG